jgi:hypothetical protein
MFKHFYGMPVTHVDSSADRHPKELGRPLLVATSELKEE